MSVIVVSAGRPATSATRLVFCGVALSKTMSSFELVTASSSRADAGGASAAQAISSSKLDAALTTRSGTMWSRLILLGCVAASAAAAAREDATDRYANAFIAQNSIPGLSLAVVR